MFNFNENPPIITNVLHEYVCPLMIMSLSVLLTQNVSDKVCTGNPKAHFIFRNLFENTTLQEKSQITMLFLAR
jgi:hypothetical protein